MTAAHTKVKPPASSSATFSASGGFAITLGWTPKQGAHPIASHILYRDDGVNYSGLTTTTYRDTDVEEGGFYQYTFATVNVNGQTSVAGASVATQLPFYPVWEAVSFIVEQNNSISVAGLCSDPLGYALTFSRAGGTAPAQVTVASDGTVSAGAAAGGSYTLIISANNGYLTTNVTATCVVSIPTDPDIPILAAPNVGSDSEISLSWTRGVSGPVPTAYDLQRGTGDGNGNANPDGSLISAQQLITAYGDTGLTAGQEYWYRVRAYSGAIVGNYSGRQFATTETAPPVANYLYTALFDSLASGRAINVMPGGYNAAGNSGTNPEGWLQQHCDQLGDNGVQSDRGNYPHACQVMNSGATTAQNYALPAPAPASRNGRKMVRFEQRDGENPLAATGARVQLRRSSLFRNNIEAWFGFCHYVPSQVIVGGVTANWPVGPDFIFGQWFDDGGGGGGPFMKISPSLTTAHTVRFKADNSNGAPITTNGFNSNLPYPKDTWNDWVIRLKRNAPGAQTIVQVWLNNILRVDYTSTTSGLGGNVAQNNTCAFLIDQYAGPPPANSRLWTYFGEVRIALASEGGSYDAVYPGNF